MLKKSFKIIAVLFLACFILSIFVVNISAEDEVEGLYIKGDPTVELVNQEMTAAHQISTFNINITFRNDGAGRTENTKVTLTDEEGFVISDEFELDSNSETTIYFVLPTILTTDQNLVINYFPTTLDESKWTPINSGNVTVVAELNDDGTSSSTPGFGILLLILSLFVIYYVESKKQKKN